MYDLANLTPGNDYKEICKEILDTNENSKYPEVASKLFQVMLDGN